MQYLKLMQEFPWDNILPSMIAGPEILQLGVEGTIVDPIPCLHELQGGRDLEEEARDSLSAAYSMPCDGSY